jgi:hypothetical protein
MGNCYWCGCELNENTSPEHIIKKSFGGNITSRKILCDKDNNHLGITIDDRISNEMDYMYDSLMFDEKSKKRITLYNMDGERVLFGVGLRPLPFLKLKANGEEKIEYFNTVEEMQNRASMLKKQLEGKNEIWNLNMVELPKTSSKYYFHKDRQAKFGSEDYYLSFVKIAIEFFLYKGGDIKYVNHAINVLKKM